MANNYYPRNGRSLPPERIDDRVRRYLNNEPLRLIAADHGITIGALCSCVKRHAPGAAGTRSRGGGKREWPA